MFQKSALQPELCQLKFDSNKEGVFEGYASVFNGVDSDNDTILPGAFDKSLASGQRPKMFVNHAQHEIPIGDWVHLETDEKGLKAVGKIDMNHKDGPSLYSALKRGAMDAHSIGFTMSPGDWTAKEGYENDDFATLFGNRDIKNLNLKEISVVSFPADDSARIAGVKSAIEGFASPKDFEKFLRERCKFSGSEATAFISAFKRAIQSDFERNQISGEVLSVFDSIKRKLA